jgi:hypothetical protein
MFRDALLASGFPAELLAAATQPVNGRYIGDGTGVQDETDTIDVMPECSDRGSASPFAGPGLAPAIPSADRLFAHEISVLRGQRRDGAFLGSNGAVIDQSSVVN